MENYSYVRFSSKPQEKGDSIRRQREMSESFCQRMGWRINDTLHLADHGKSAYKGEHVSHGTLGKFVAKVEAGEIHTPCRLLVESLDRISRQGVKIGMKLFDRIIDAGVIVVTFNPERIYDDKTAYSTIGRVELALQLERAHEESRMKGDRVRESYIGKRKRGERFLNHRPGWIAAADGRYVVIEEKAEPVRELLRRLAEGESLRGIVSDFLWREVPYFGTSGRWHRGAIMLSLRSRHAIGEGEQAGQRIPNYYPRIIDDETFNRAVNAVEKRKVATKQGGRASGTSNLFTGLAIDARDGSPMWLIREEGRPYLMAKASSESRLPRITLHYPIVESVLLGFIAEFQFGSEEEPARRLRERIDALGGEIAALDRQLGRLRKSLADPNLEDAAYRQVETTLKDVAARHAEAMRDRNTLEGELAVVRGADSSARSLASSLQSAEESGEVVKLRQRLKIKLAELIESVWILPVKTGLYSREAILQVNLRGDGSRVITLQYTAHPHHGMQRKVTTARMEELPDYVDLRHRHATESD
jgi:DNA invertase Pin-like site-specific DNA recombinase